MSRWVRRIWRRCASCTRWRIRGTGSIRGCWRRVSTWGCGRGRLVAVAGVHVFSPRWRVAAVGNVTTHPGARGRGLAAGAVAALCARLAGSVDHITLNVRSDNAAAVRLYGRLGFTRVAGFTECALTRRVSSVAAAG
ncbi:GNAT family N-acetyltransferase [Micromonospora robiginosa]|uniref:GNAT family N-acetyltransferase n=1 Tax=Micromonospora robiginosa TaxID=2749844 RepID=A0AAF0P4S1_9ACTN|nr:GNAT family N-acetyltransferase [Micromonospora ferruginea]WMF04517.1 GNAT family N-acetyltransferase [Micromonospora ferruginea]